MKCVITKYFQGDVLISLFVRQGSEDRRKYDGRVILPGDLNRFRKIELDYDQNIFTVEFASDNFNLPDKTTYQYNLKGLGDGWLVLPAGINRVTFTSLAPGTYTLNVKATNSDGYEGTDVARLTIVVHPPFWLAWWAWLCYAFVLCRCCFLPAGISCEGNARSTVCSR